MRSLVFDEIHQVSIHDRTDPLPSAGEVVIDVGFAGICGSDLHGYTGETGRRFPGTVMGHEASGIVSSVGSDVDAGLIGERVTFNPVITCTSACGHVLENRCETLRLIGVHHGLDGAFADRVAVPVDRIHKLGDLSLEVGAMIEPLAVGWHAAKLVDGVPGPLLVIGAGMIGLAVAHMAASLGVHDIIVCDVDDRRLDVAGDLGFGASKPGSVGNSEYLRVVDAVGTTSSAATAIASSRRGAVIAIVGLGDRDLSIPTQALVGGERTVVGSFAYTNDDFGAVVNSLRSGKSTLDSFPRVKVPLAGAADAFSDLAAGRRSEVKILLEIGAETSEAG